jgi:hypothetical protein
MVLLMGSPFHHDLMDALTGHARKLRDERNRLAGCASFANCLVLLLATLPETRFRAPPSGRRLCHPSQRSPHEAAVCLLLMTTIVLM